MKLPIGIQTFDEIRENGYLYIDKTQQIHRVISGGKYFFLSRPRRFGKSLLLSTMKSLYEGRKDLFEGLWIENNWNWERILPVIHVQFSKTDYQGKGLDNAISDIIDANATRLGIKLKQTSFKSRFAELIEETAIQNPSRKVVLLIDEYDKPIIDYLKDIPQANINRSILKSFYSVLKDSDPYLELVFITGVSRFAKTSIFSDLNNVQNLTMDESAVDLVGITYAETSDYFTERLHFLATKKKMSFEELHEQMRFWYNGYSWDGKTKVYNPFSLLSFMKAGQFLNFWFETGTPTFLVEAMRDKKIYNIETILASERNLSAFDIENLSVHTVLFQTGYLTIEEEVAIGLYRLTYPNNEVRISLEEYLLSTFAYDSEAQGKANAYYLAQAIKKGDIDEVVKIINTVFSTIPYQLWKKDNEAFYHALLHLTLSLMGVYIQTEINTSNGRLDSVVQTDSTIYIFEFKLDKSADEAIQQIQDKAYFKPYLMSPQKRLGVGINFSTEQKEIEGYKVVEF